MPRREPGRLTYRVPRETKSESVKEDNVKSAEKTEEVEEKEAEEPKESIFDRFGRMLGKK